MAVRATNVRPRVPEAHAEPFTLTRTRTRTPPCVPEPHAEPFTLTRTRTRTRLEIARLHLLVTCVLLTYQAPLLGEIERLKQRVCELELEVD